MPLDTRIAGTKTVQDWINLRSKLIKDGCSKDDWKEAGEFLQLRIQSRFLKPIESILKAGEKQGEGHAVAALLCILVEFPAALDQGRVYCTPLPEDAIPAKADELGISTDTLKGYQQPHEYSSSRELFLSFLTGNNPFRKVFTKKKHADTYYADVRCGLLHEAATKDNSNVLAEKEGDTDCLLEIRKDGLTIYRNAFQKALVKWIATLDDRLQADSTFRTSFLRKMDDIAQVRRCFYFAYGSNLEKTHLLARIGHIHNGTRVKLGGYTFLYNKKSDDGAKANIVKNGSEVWGVCYEIDRSEFTRLHNDFEKGYEPKDVWVVNDEGKGIIAKTFVSKSLTKKPPTQNYVALVVNGANDHQLPEDYIKKNLQITVSSLCSPP
jgi:hypothetical protein